MSVSPRQLGHVSYYSITPPCRDARELLLQDVAETADCRVIILEMSANESKLKVQCYNFVVPVQS